MDEWLTAIYDYIANYKATQGYSPTQDEIAQEMGLTKTGVVRAMEQMEASEMIVRPRGLLQAIKLLSRLPNQKQGTINSASEPQQITYRS